MDVGCLRYLLVLFSFFLSTNFTTLFDSNYAYIELRLLSFIPCFPLFYLHLLLYHSTLFNPRERTKKEMSFELAC